MFSPGFSRLRVAGQTAPLRGGARGSCCGDVAAMAAREARREVRRKELVAGCSEGGFGVELQQRDQTAPSFSFGGFLTSVSVPGNGRQS